MVMGAMPGRLLWTRVGIVALGMGVLAGCSPVEKWWQRWQADEWYGYYYDNVMMSGAPAMSRPFASAAQCMASMRDYTRTSSRSTGFACARGCTAHKDGTVTDCAQVVH